VAAIAVNERTPASTAHTASPTMTAGLCRTPRRCLGSATVASTASRPDAAFASIVCEVSKVADERIKR
jgi:hypothetical protein